MVEAPYEAEEVLQQLLADYPNLLAGDQEDEQGRRWLLVQRELGVASEEEGADRWSLDHLFLDQEGVPTLVEVKRSSDTRIRREVVGQMLDYAANGSVFWGLETIRSSFERAREAAGENPGTALDTFLKITRTSGSALVPTCRLGACAWFSWPPRFLPSFAVWSSS